MLPKTVFLVLCPSKQAATYVIDVGKGRSLFERVCGVFWSVAREIGESSYIVETLPLGEKIVFSNNNSWLRRLNERKKKKNVFKIKRSRKYFYKTNLLFFPLSTMAENIVC